MLVLKIYIGIGLEFVNEEEVAFYSHSYHVSSGPLGLLYNFSEPSLSLFLALLFSGVSICTAYLPGQRIQ